MARFVLAALTALALAGAAQAAPLSSREFADLKREAGRALKAGDWRGAAEALRALGADDSPRALDFLCEMAKVPDAVVYKAACEAVAAMRAPEVEAKIQDVLRKSGGSAVNKMLLVDAMAERADRFAAEALGAALSARQAEVQRAALAAIGRKKLLGAMDGLIALLERLERREGDGLNANLVRQTLEDLTKESFATAADWRNFWEPRRGSFERPTTGDVKRPAEDATRRRERPTFFGSELRSNRLVFVIDVSGSMTAADPPGRTTTGGARRGPVTGGGQQPDRPAAPESRVRIERAKQQLAQAIEALPEDARFTIMAYSGVLLRGPNGPMLPPGSDPNEPLPPKIADFEWLQIWQPKLVTANPASKKAAQEFVAGLQANGGTFTFNALRAALEVEGADTIVLLSDGMPNDVDRATSAPLSEQQILDEIATLNRFKRRVIDTFGFDPEGGAQAGGPLAGGFGGGTGARPRPAGHGAGGGGDLGRFMQELAEQNGGAYTQID